MTPVHHKGTIQRSISTANGVKITQEYSRCHQILFVGHISRILIKICNFPKVVISHIILVRIFLNNSKREGFRA